MSKPSRIYFEGTVYANANSMPADVRERYERARTQLPDSNNDGVPDLYESNDLPGVTDTPIVSVPGAPTVSTVQRTGAKASKFAWLLGVGLVVGILGFIVAIFVLITSIMKSSGIYQDGVKAAMADETVQSVLGLPIREGIFVMGEISESGSSGDADLTVPLYGSQQSGTLIISGYKQANVWHVSVLQLETSGRTIQVRH